jgi:hypothetical protein
MLVRVRMAARGGIGMRVVVGNFGGMHVVVAVLGIHHNRGRRLIVASAAD